MQTTDTRDGSHRARRRGARAAIALAVGVGIAGSGAVVYQASFAAFTATTVNEGNAWETGSLTLTDDDGGAALFRTADLGYLDGDESGVRCITVTAAGTLSSTVTMTATGTGPLAPHLLLDIDRGTAAPTGAGDCTDFSHQADVYSGPLSGLEAALTPPAETWTSTPTSTRTYRIAWSFPPGDDAVPQGAHANATFTWTSRS